MTLARLRGYFLYALMGFWGMLIALPAMAQNPYTMANNSWISIDGTVKTVSPNTFTLDYGEGMVTVEMDDGDRDADAYKLLPDDKVRVFGKIDDDFFEATTIEASSVYVEKLGTYFFASAVDEEDVDVTYVAATSPIVVSATVLKGIVTDVRENEFTLNTGVQAIDIDVSSMAYNPLDDEGYQHVDIGDRIWVSGTMKSTFFEGRELMADSVVILHEAKLAG